jgi:N utilization substance protein A
MKSDFIIALTQLAAERNLSKDIVLSAIEAALASAYRRDSIAAGQNISVKLDPNSGDVNVSIVKTVVEEVEDPLTEMTLADAKKISPIADLGDNVPIGELPHSAGRIAAQTAKQVVIQRLREAERDIVFQEYSDKVGEVYTVAVQRIESGRHVIVELGRAEAVLPMSEQSPYDRYRVGQRYKVLLKSIDQSVRGPEIIVSRADKALVRRLFEMEVPEIYNGAVEIVGIAREAGSRSKVAVFARQEGVDAVGSCVGLRGIRIQNIVNELHGEKIDVVEWSRDPTRFIKNSLSPALVMKVQVDQEEGAAMAVVPERQLSLAIGKEGQNARLAAKLTGLKIDIISDVEATVLEAEQAKLAAQKAAEEAARPAPEPEPAPVMQEEAPAAVGEPMPAPTVVEEEEPEVLAPAATVPEALQPAAEVAQPAAAEAAPVEAPTVMPEVEMPEVAEIGEYVEPEIPEELFFVEDEPEPVPVAEEATPLHDLPDDIWNISQGGAGDSGVIRFAEDIEELALRGSRGGGGRRRRGGGGGGNRRRGGSSRRR